jgi:hypothetical protein
MLREHRRRHRDGHPPSGRSAERQALRPVMEILEIAGVSLTGPERIAAEP